MKTGGQICPLGPQQRCTGILSSLKGCQPPRHPSTQFTRWDLVTFPLPSPLSGYLCPELKCPALQCLSRALQRLLSPAQPLQDQKMLATNSATSSFCKDPWPLLTGGQFHRSCSQTRLSGVHQASTSCRSLCWALAMP